jgi:glycosyltransferase involved in cell wall biosynthesis
MKTLSVCATYGRIPYLGRMLSAFINQNYDVKHLVIVNDDKNVELCCNRKDVTVINCNQRLKLPDKRNLGIALGQYDIIFPMDDDDILTGDRISNHLKHYDDPDVNAYRNLASYIIYGDVFKRADSPPHNSISFKQSEWWRVGGYTDNYIYEDVDLHDRMQGVKTSTCENCMDFVYQFGGVNYHLSYNPRQIYSLEEMAYKQLESLNLVGKKFWIEPDFEQYNNVMLLKKLFDKDKKDLTIKHVGDAKIDISHLL